MPTYFEFKQLKNGYTWKDFLPEREQAGYHYALNILKIPKESIESVKCYPYESCLGIVLKPDKKMIRRPWFHRLIETHAYRRTEYNLMTFF